MAKATTADVRQVLFLFRYRFVDPVRDGTKRQTVRNRRKRPPRPGDVLSLRYWTGSPYRSPQALIVPPVLCVSVSPVTVEVDSWANLADVSIGGEPLTHDEVCAFVRADGFSCVSDFCDYHHEHGSESFEGDLIRWEATS